MHAHTPSYDVYRTGRSQSSQRTWRCFPTSGRGRAWSANDVAHAPPRALAREKRCSRTPGRGLSIAELDPLRHRQVRAPVDRVRLPPHVRFPRVRAALAAAAGFSFRSSRISGKRRPGAGGRSGAADGCAPPALRTCASPVFRRPVLTLRGGHGIQAGRGDRRWARTPDDSVCRHGGRSCGKTQSRHSGRRRSRNRDGQPVRPGNRRL
jgi:hypothetical protein